MQNLPQPRNPMEKDFLELQKTIGVSFQNLDLLRQAMVHRSYLNENPQFPLEHNERLEFLGDAVLELIVTEHLYARYPNPEGELTNWRASLVNAKMLGELAVELGLDTYLYLSRGEAQDTNGKARQSILANAFEALIGAIYLDQGMPATKRFIEERLLVKLPVILRDQLYRDPKSRLQEIAQEQFGITPTYRVLKEEGPDHAKHFTVGVYIGSDQIGAGDGSSKQDAQVAAAQQALQGKQWS